MATDGTTRRDFLRRLGLGAAALGVGAVPRASAAGPSARPNVVLIMADDLGRECLGAYGGKSYPTPHLDAMAAAGVRFDHCYAGPLCTPSRVQIMTGRYNFRNYEIFGILDPAEKTFGHVAQSAGYATAVVGKWQLRGGGAGATPEAAGFDEHCLSHPHDGGRRYGTPTMLRNGALLKQMEGAYGPDIACDYAIDFIDRHREKPFFLYYPMILPHKPFRPTPDVPEWKTQPDAQRPAFFGHMVTYLDKLVGRLQRHLAHRGLERNTLVIFTSDNGTPQGIHSQMGDRVIRGAKGRTTDAGTHVPLIARWGSAPSGGVCPDLVDLSDFLPTVAEAVRAPLPNGRVIDGRSFLPQVRGEPGRPREWIYCYFDPRMRKFKHQKRVYARDPRFKLYDSGELFDALADPMELAAVAPGTSAAADASRARLQQVIEKMRQQGA